MSEPGIRLTGLSHGGGCGCKIAPGVLERLLADLPPAVAHRDLLVGRESNDDAAVYRLNNYQAVVATTDFFMPIVDDPRDFGAIAATNALSDIYAVGGRPLFALAIVGMPLDKLPSETIGQILKGGAEACADAGVIIAGGHSIDAPEPIYGLAVVGDIEPGNIKRNDRAQAGDLLILGKPLGIGILAAALQRGELPPDGYANLRAVTLQRNAVGMRLGEMPFVHAMTDVTGFGLLGHLAEMCRGSGLAARLDRAAVPLLPAALGLAKAGIGTGAASRNFESCRDLLALPIDFPDWQRQLLCDPQTSGGLLVAAAPQFADEVLVCFRQEGFSSAAIVGCFEAASPGILIE